MQIIRVFPRRTRATPTDGLVVVGRGPELFDQADEVHISVTFTWDLPLAEKLATAWKSVAPVKIGGPATGERGGDFIPGRYLKPGYVITSRGCPNRCWFCSVWKREGGVRELPIRDGWNVLDDNLLACSEDHIRAVFSMLERQTDPIEFTGGMDAKLLKPWHVDAIKRLRPKQMFFAYDTPDDFEPLVAAGELFHNAGIGMTKTGRVSHNLRCYCLIGYPNDTIGEAEGRLRAIYAGGFLPMAMLYRGEDNRQPAKEWRRFQKHWARPASISRIARDKVAAWA